MRLFRLRPLGWLLLFWMTAQMLYAPAWQAGWVRDVTGWLESLHTQAFGDYLLRRGKLVQSLYPFTQAVLWAVWKLVGVSPLAWHVLMVSMHALCAWGWVRLSGALLRAGGVAGASGLALFAGAAFLVSPYATEVVVWEAGFHYLLAMLLQLGTLGAVWRFMQTGGRRYVLAAIGLFVPATLSLEVFLLTPLYAALLLIWGRSIGRLPAGRFRSGFRLVVLPVLVLTGLQYGAYRLLYSRPVPHVGALHLAWLADYARKPAKYAFHLFGGGRYWPAGVRDAVYRLLNSVGCLVAIYGIAVALLVGLWRRRRRLEAPRKTLLLVAGLAVGALVLVLPLHFHQEGYVYFDRYAYFLLPPSCVLLGWAMRQLPAAALLRCAVLVTQAALLLGTVSLWRQSDALSRRMLAQLPAAPAGVTTVLLNVPNALQGVPMIGATRDGEAALMRRYVLQKPFSGVLLEPTACNLNAASDTVQLQAVAAHGLRVSLPSRQGWWSGGVPTERWENNLFRVQLPDAAATYELMLKEAPSRYRLLVWTRNAWHRVVLPG